MDSEIFDQIEISLLQFVKNYMFKIEQIAYSQISTICHFVAALMRQEIDQQQQQQQHHHRLRHPLLRRYRGLPTLNPDWIKSFSSTTLLSKDW